MEAGRFGKLLYRLARPVAAAGPAPLVLYLHGAGGAGEDNRRQLERGSGFSLTRLLETPEPFYLVAPQCPPSEAWYSQGESPSQRGALVLSLLDDLAARFHIDPRRVYLIGPSMGGHGVWDLGWRHPDRWAALVPICGAAPLARLPALALTPVWCFHGDQDHEVPVDLSRQAVRILSELGAPVLYTELPGIGHNCTAEVMGRDDLLPWLFQQARSR